MKTSGTQQLKHRPIQLKPLPPAKVEIINLIDVLITLIAFFMLTTVFADNQNRLRVDLPHSKHVSSEREQSRLTLEIRSDESIWVNGNPVASDQLEETLRQTAPGTVVAIRGDRNVSYQMMVHLLDLLNENHLSRVCFEVKKVEN